MSDITDNSEVTNTAPDELPEYRSLRSDVWRQFRRHRGAMIGLVILVIIVVVIVVPVVPEGVVARAP